MRKTISVEVRRTFYGKLIMWFIPFLIDVGLISLSQGVNLTNKLVLNNKTMKIRLNKGKWKSLDLSEYEMEMYSYE